MDTTVKLFELAIKAMNVHEKNKGKLTIEFLDGTTKNINSVRIFSEISYQNFYGYIEGFVDNEEHTERYDLHIIKNVI